MSLARAGMCVLLLPTYYFRGSIIVGWAQKSCSVAGGQLGTGDEPGIVVGPDTLPFLHFSISAPTLTYHDAQN